MQLNEKGYYFTVLMFALFAVAKRRPPFPTPYWDGGDSPQWQEQMLSNYLLLTAPKLCKSSYL